jgi:hypothetical protein
MISNKGDGLEVDDFFKGKKYLFICHNILYYYVKLWIIIVHDHVILKAFQVF